MTDLPRFLSPASFALPRHGAGAAWAEHLPFLVWLVSALRPRLLVCVAAGPFPALCDVVAAERLDCRALGPLVPGDTWPDAHPGFASPLDPEAPPPAGVDLLLLPPGADPASWLPRLSPGGVMLRPGTVSGAGFRFLHGGGLLVEGGERPPPALAALLEADPALVAAVREAYGRLGGHLTTLAQLRAAREALTAANARASRPPPPSALASVLPAQLAAAQAREAAAAAHAAELLRALQVMRESTSWRLTAPLRTVMHRLPGVRRRARGALRLVWWTVTLRLGRRLAEERGVRPALAARGLAVEAPWPPPLPAAPVPAAARPPCAATVVVCVHDAPEDVARCLDSLAAHGRAGTALVLVDDGSAAPTRDLLRLRAPALGARLIRHDSALGYTRSANVGLAAATGEMVVLLNSDTVVTAGWLDALQRALEHDGETAAAGPLSNTASWQSVPLLSDGADWAENPLPPGLDLSGMAAMVAERAALHPLLPFINGFCLALRRSALEAVGLLDEAAFPTGYGEENDLCIRLRRAGHRLRVADDAFVWHAQSRSFSHERRLVLARAAGEALARKHDSTRDIDRPAAFCRHSLAMHGVREWTAARLDREALRRAGRAHEGRAVGFVLPVAAEGGGANVVLQEAQALARMGVTVRLLNLRRNRPGALGAYPETAELWTWLDDEAAVAPAIAALRLDAVVATAHQSAYWLPLASDLPRVRLAYYVQDYEPLFYDPLDPEHALARGSYLQDPRRLLLTKTGWNRDVLRREVAVEAVPLGASVDVDRFRPVDRSGWEAPAATLRVCAMVRPSSARRAPEATWRLLAELSARHGRAVECHVFGAEEAELASYRVRFPGAVRNHGRLRRDEVAALFQNCDAFVDLSSYQAMGLSLLEAMSCGLAVIGPIRGGAGELVTEGVDGFLVPTEAVEPAAALLDRMVSGGLELDALRRAAVTTASRLAPDWAALRMLEALFGEAGRPGPG